MTSGRKRILFFIPTLAAGGAERSFTLLLRYLDRNSFEPHLGLLQAEGEYLRDVPDDVIVHDLRTPRVRYALPGLVRLVRRIRPHAVLSTPAHLSLALVLVKPFLPDVAKLVVREAATASVVIREETHWPQVWTWLYRRLYKRADKIVCLSDAMVEDMVEHFSIPREKLVRIYNPVDTRQVRKLSEEGASPYSGPGPHLVAAGRLCRAKGFDILLTAMPAIRAAVPHATLTILGEGPLRDDLVGQAGRLGLGGAVRFLGFQQNPWAYFKHADLFVLPSRYEGLPNALLEALALATPVVATDCPGAIREVKAFAPDIDLVPPEDSNELSRAIIAACTRGSRRDEPRTPAEEVVTRFGLQQVVGEYGKLLAG